MRTIAPVLVLCGIALAGSAGTLTAQTPIPDARKAAEAWLALVDSSRFEESWKQSAPLLQQMTRSPQGWESFLAQARSRFGTPGPRAFTSAEENPVIPGAPGGEYLRLLFTVKYDRGPVGETVVMVPTNEGWKVAMYGLRPMQE
ncbi:MAG: DUF4019 domain-containing protein [Gemmatimonadales bacterium]